MSETASKIGSGEREDIGAPRSRESSPIGIDLSTLLPGGLNGGAKLVALEIARWLPELAPHEEFVLLTGAHCHEELAGLDRENARRWLMPADASLWQEMLLARPAMRLLLCPMTAPPWADPRVPLISVVHDLQHLTYPEFFAAEEIAARGLTYAFVRNTAAHVVTVSEYVRASVSNHLGMPRDRITAIHNGRSRRFPGLSELEVKEVLWKNGLEHGGFFLFPANPWPHKNHHVLLTAFALFLDRHPQAGIHLVLTGSADPTSSPLARTVNSCGLSDHVLVTGFVPDNVMEALLRSCLALVYPSLYEGFGMPLLEAMAFGRPVLASDRTSLPEAAGGAALLFDPRRPEEIARAMERVAFEVSLADELGQLGRVRAAQIGDGEEMGRQYLRLIRQCLESGARLPKAVVGLWEDGWTGRQLIIASDEAVEVEIELCNWLHDPVEITWRVGDQLDREAFDAGQTCGLAFELDERSGSFELLVEPTHCPAEVGESADSRRLGIFIVSSRVRGSDGLELSLQEFIDRS